MIAFLSKIKQFIQLKELETKTCKISQSSQIPRRRLKRIKKTNVPRTIEEIQSSPTLVKKAVIVLSNAVDLKVLPYQLANKTAKEIRII